MEDKEREIEAFLARPTLVLDLANLSDAQRQESLPLLGGCVADFVRPGDDFDMQEVTDAVFNWGDEKMDDVAAQLIEHNEPPSSAFFPFSLATILGEQIWSLTVQDKEFSPSQAYRSEDDYVLLSGEPEEAITGVARVMTQAPTHIEILGRVGSRYVLFSMGTNINPITEE